MVSVQSAAIVVLMAGNMGWAQGTIQPQDRAKDATAETDMVRLVRNVHPAAPHTVSSAAVEASFPVEHMILLLLPDQAQETALGLLVAQQPDARSNQCYKSLLPNCLQRASERRKRSHLDRGWLGQHSLRVDDRNDSIALA